MEEFDRQRQAAMERDISTTASGGSALGVGRNETDKTGGVLIHRLVRVRNFTDPAWKEIKGDNIRRDNSGNTPLHYLAMQANFEPSTEDKVLSALKKSRDDAKKEYEQAYQTFNALSQNYKKQKWGDDKNEKATFDQKMNIAKSALDISFKKFKEANKSYEEKLNETFNNLVPDLINRTCFSLPNSDGHTPLHLAALSGNTKLLIAILEKSATWEKQNSPLEIKNSKNGQTALHVAAQQADETSLQLLIKHGANVGAVDNKGNMPLHLLADSAKATPAAFKALVLDPSKSLTPRKNVGLSQLNGSGLAPIHLAIRAGNKEIVESLLFLDPKQLNLKTQGGVSPLTEAIQQNQLEISALLIKKGAKVEPAAQEGFMHLVQITVDKLRNLNAQATKYFLPPDVEIALTLLSGKQAISADDQNTLKQFVKNPNTDRNIAEKINSLVTLYEANTTLFKPASSNEASAKTGPSISSGKT